MGSVAEVLSYTVKTDESGHGADVQGDVGGDTVTAEHFADSGDDSPPLVGDFMATNEAPGSGNEQVTGYSDTKVARVAGPGEKRLYSRSAPGVVAAVIWLKADGSIDVSNEMGALEMAPSGDVTINGVVFDMAGNMRAPGQVTAKAGPAAVGLSTHLHPSGVGPTGAPIPLPT